MTAVIITGNKYPKEDAGAIRQHATAKILHELGYEVLVLGYGKPTGHKTNRYEEIEYISFRPATGNTAIRAIFRYFFINRAAHYIKKHIKKIDVLLVVDALPKDFRIIGKIAAQYHAKIVHDSVEWYSPEEFAEGSRNRSYLNKEYTNTKAIGKGWRVIAISKYLQAHFQSRCDRVVRMPVIMDIISIPAKIDVCNDKTVFVYAGGPGKKDYLATMIQAFSLLSKEKRNQAKLHIVGVSREQLISQCGVDQHLVDDLRDMLEVHGRVSHDEAVAFVQNANYTILIRDETLRYAKAGFPTKVVESMACGTPVLCNLSSDLRDYLTDKENAIIASGHKPEDVHQAILSAMMVDTKEYRQMRVNARVTAEKFFDYGSYIQIVGDLLQ